MSPKVLYGEFLEYRTDTFFRYLIFCVWVCVFFFTLHEEGVRALGA